MTTAATRNTRLWRLQGSRSSAGFAVRSLGVRTVSGQVPIREAWIAVDPDGRPTAVGAVLDLATIDTGHARRDSDLRRPSLLDTAKYPTLTFDASGIDPDGEIWTLVGPLAACGHRTDLRLTATTTRGGDDSMTVHATTEFDRRDLGIRAPRFLMGHRVRVTVDAVFTPPA